jgi:hypothetical protein
MGTGVSETVDDLDHEAGRGSARRYTRRLSDKILIAFHQACDQGELEVAGQLLGVLEMMLKRQPSNGDRRRPAESLVAAHERLWHLRNPDTGYC